MTAFAELPPLERARLRREADLTRALPPALPVKGFPMFLKIFESALASAADEAMQNPSGGFLGFLVKNPSVGAAYAMLLPVAHNYLSKLEPATAAPVAPPA